MNLVDYLVYFSRCHLGQGIRGPLLGSTYIMLKTYCVVARFSVSIYICTGYLLMSLAANVPGRVVTSAGSTTSALAGATPRHMTKGKRLEYYAAILNKHVLINTRQAKR